MFLVENSRLMGENSTIVALIMVGQKTSSKRSSFDQKVWLAKVHVNDIIDSNFFCYYSLAVTATDLWEIKTVHFVVQIL